MFFTLSIKRSVSCVLFIEFYLLLVTKLIIKIFKFRSLTHKCIYKIEIIECNLLLVIMN